MKNQLIGTRIIRDERWPVNAAAAVRTLEHACDYIANKFIEENRLSLADTRASEILYALSVIVRHGKRELPVDIFSDPVTAKDILKCFTKVIDIPRVPE